MWLPQCKDVPHLHISPSGMLCLTSHAEMTALTSVEFPQLVHTYYYVAHPSIIGLSIRLPPPDWQLLTGKSCVQCTFIFLGDAQFWANSRCSEWHQNNLVRCTGSWKIFIGSSEADSNQPWGSLGLRRPPNVLQSGSILSQNIFSFHVIILNCIIFKLQRNTKEVHWESKTLLCSLTLHWILTLGLCVKQTYGLLGSL